MAFWLILALFVGSTVVSALLQPRPKDVKPSSLGDFQVPTADASRVVQVTFGTVKCAGPNVIYYGNLKVQPIKKGAGFFGLIKAVVGYKYFLTMWLGISHGEIGDIVGLRVGTHPDDKDVPFTKTRIDEYFELNINQPDLFGGDEREGGLKGTARVYVGSGAQEGDPHLATLLDLDGAPAPAMRGICTMVLEDFYVGTSQYIKNISPIVRRIPNPLDLTGEQANMNGDANPANIIYEVMTNAVWGLGQPPQDIDLQSFRDAGYKLWADGYGISMNWDSDGSADQFISDILRHIDGALYTDPRTGLWTLKLARADYDPASLIEFTKDDVIDTPDRSRGSWNQTLNQIVVNYTDRETFTTKPVKADELANFTTQGEVSTETLDYHGFSNAIVAQKVAFRELKVASYPLAKIRVKFNRRAWQLRIASVFRFTWEPLGIQDQVFRVTQINYGDLLKGEIEVEACEDIFAITFTAYTAPGGTKWTDPATEEQPPAAQFLEEAPYQLLVSADRRLLVQAVRADGLALGFQVWSDESGAGYTSAAYLSNTVPYFCPSGLLGSSYSKRTAALDVAGFDLIDCVDLDLLTSVNATDRDKGVNLLVIVDADGNFEWCAWQTATANGDGTYRISNIVRGIFDTIPLDHAQGARVWFISDAAAYTRVDPYTHDQTIWAKCLPFNFTKAVSEALVTAISATMESRAQQPYPPGKVRINGQEWPSTIDGDATLTWAHRIRTAQDFQEVVHQDASSTPGTIEGTYTVEVLIDGVVKRTQTGITGTSFLYTTADRASDDADLTKLVQFRITPVNADGLAGTSRLTDPFGMDGASAGGFGLVFGEVFGGLDAPPSTGGGDTPTLPAGDGDEAAPGDGTSLSAQTAHNTSAYNDYNKDSANLDVRENFSGHYLADGATKSCDINRYDDSLNPTTPSNISKKNLHTLLYPGATTEIYAHLMPWHNSSGHKKFGYESNSLVQCQAQVADMFSRGIRGLTPDWYGPDSTHHNEASLKMLQAAEEVAGFKFYLTHDVGAIDDASNKQQKLIDDLNYANDNFYGSGAYLKEGGRPIVLFFGHEKYKSSLNWSAVRAAVDGNPLFIFRNAAGINPTYANGQSDGGYAWPAPQSKTSGDPSALGYLENFYNTAADYLAQLIFGVVYDHFNGTLSTWSQYKDIQGFKGLTWLRTFAKINQHYSSSNQLRRLQLIWNDYEEGSCIEMGIDNEIAIAASVNGSGVLSWGVSGGTGDTQTIAGFRVMYGTDTAALTVLGDFAPSTFSLNLATLLPGLASGTYKVYVKALGKPCIENKMSNEATWNKP
jgi:hypothetical protein